MLEVTIYGSPGDEPDTGAVFEGIDYVSLVSNETYGPPALIAPARGTDRDPRAAVEDEVLYINTSLVPVWKIVRVSD